MNYLQSFLLILLLGASTLLAPGVLHAQSSQEPSLPTSQPSQEPSLPTSQPPTQGVGDSNSLTNPLQGSGITTVDGLLVALLGILVIIATPIVVIFIILAGFKYVTAQGDTNKLQEAKRALVYAIIGGVLIIGAEVLAEIIRGTVDSFR